MKRRLKILTSNSATHSNSPHEKSWTGSFGTAIVGVSRTFSTDSTQQSTCSKYENNEQYCCDYQASVIAINWILCYIFLGSVDMTEWIVANIVWCAVDLVCERVADVDHGWSDINDRHFDFRNIRFDHLLDIFLHIFDFTLAGADCVLQIAVEQFLDILDDFTLVGQLICGKKIKK